MPNVQKHIHIIGIAGVATSAIAIAFKNVGWKVTGSDKGFFPPVSTELTKHGVSFYAGWHIEKIGMPDIAVVGTASGSKNPETAYMKEKNIPIYSFAEAVGKFFVREKSIVVAGTWGKTSSSALLSFILQKAKLDPSYMFGGISISHDSSAKLTDSKYSVFEGDEYKSSPTDTTPKFAYYKPTHLLLTAISWDHADLYPTEEKYFDTFKNLISKVDFIVACKDNAGIKRIVDEKGLVNEEGSVDEKKVIWYGKNNAKYTYGDIEQSRSGLNFKINGIPIYSPMLGEFQIENITGCFALAKELGIDEKIIIEAIREFEGLKRRLEKRYSDEIEVFDDIAHSGEKAQNTLSTLRNIYTKKIIAIFEPNAGGRERSSIEKYDDAFKNADLVIIPRLTNLKVGDNEDERPMDGNELASIISKTHKNTVYIENDTNLIDRLKDEAKAEDIIIFMGSHGFRGMIEEIINYLPSSTISVKTSLS